MNLTDFYEVYPDEEACEHALREFRECHTLYCPECGGLHLSWNPSHKSWIVVGLILYMLTDVGAMLMLRGVWNG